MNAIDFNTYNKISQLNAMMNRIVREATTVKTEMTASLRSDMRALGIGNKVDVLA